MSSSSRSSRRLTLIRPDLVEKLTDEPVIRICPEAIVAWPHISTSAVGVNQRRSKSASPLSLGTVNAVSLRLFSAAIACITASSSHLSSGITAAGLPVSGFSANASTWKKGMLVIVGQSLGLLGDLLREQGLPVSLPFRINVDQDLGIRESLLQFLLR